MESALALHVPDDAMDQQSSFHHAVSKSRSDSLSSTDNHYDANELPALPSVAGSRLSSSFIHSMSSSSSSLPTDGRMDNIDSFYGRLAASALNHSSMAGGMGANGDDDNYGDYNEYTDGDTKKPKVYDDYHETHGVRRPDPVKAQRLVSHTPHELFHMRQNAMGLNRADPPEVEWMFPPPRHLSYPELFEESKQLAKSDKKWLLVNIQNHNDFSSHMLNRDTWSDEVSQIFVIFMWMNVCMCSYFSICCVYIGYTIVPS